MQAVATWLVARPLNAVMTLAATLLLPFVNTLSGAVVALLVLAKGERVAAVKLLIALTLLSVFVLVVKAPAIRVMVTALVLTVPALVFATVLLKTRSFALTLQVSLITAAAAVGLFYVAITDLVAFWAPMVEQMAQAWREMGLEQQFKPLLDNPTVLAGSLTTAMAVSIWLSLVGVLLLGYWLYKQLPGDQQRFGRVRDLDFGRVIALITAVASVLAFLLGATWIQSIAFLFFVAFSVQGLALLHWLHSDGPLPVAAVIAAYAAIVILHVYMLTALAVVGYTDAWFRYRRRALT